MIQRPQGDAYTDFVRIQIPLWIQYLKNFDQEYAEFFLTLTRNEQYSHELLSLLANPFIMTAMPDHFDKLTELYPEILSSKYLDGFKKIYSFSNYTMPKVENK